MSNKIIPSFCIFIWLCSSVYFGSGGYNYLKINMDRFENEKSPDTIKVKYKGTTYKNKQALSIALEKEAIIRMYPMINSLPTIMFDLITIFAFGVLGSVTNLFKQIVLYKRNVDELNYISEPILGMLTGFIIIGLSYLIPSSLAINDIVFKPISIMFLSLFSGFFSLRFYTYLENLFGKIFKGPS